MGSHNPNVANQIQFHYIKVTTQRGVFNFSEIKHLDFRTISKIENVPGKSDFLVLYVNGKPDTYRIGTETLRNIFIWTIYNLSQRYCKSPIEVIGFDIGAINVLSRVGDYASRCPLLTTVDALSILQQSQEEDLKSFSSYQSMLISDTEMLNLELYFNTDQFKGLSSQNVRKELDSIVAADEDNIYSHLVEWEEDRNGPIYEISQQLEGLNDELTQMENWLDTKSEYYIKMKQGLNIISSQNYAIQYQIENQRKLCEELDSFVKRLDLDKNIVDVLRNFDKVMGEVGEEAKKYGETAMTVGVEKAETVRIRDQEASKQKEGAIERVVHAADGLLLLKSLYEEDYNGISFTHMKAIKEQQQSLEKEIVQFYGKIGGYLQIILNQSFANTNATLQSVHNQMILLAPLYWIIQKRDPAVCDKLRKTYAENMTQLVSKTLKDFFYNTKRSIVRGDSEGLGRLMDLNNSVLGHQQEEMRSIQEQYNTLFNGDTKCSVAGAFKKSLDFVVPLVRDVNYFSLHFFCGGSSGNDTFDDKKKYKESIGRKNVQSVKLNPQDVVHIQTIQLILSQIFSDLFNELLNIVNNENKSYIIINII